MSFKLINFMSMNFKSMNLKLVVFFILFSAFQCFFVIVKSCRKKKKMFKTDLITSFILLLLSLCQWFIDNKLSIYLGEDKTKPILFSKVRGLREINISSAGHSITQNGAVEYLGCQLESKLSGEAMASKVLKKINAKLKLLYRHSRYLNSGYRRLLCHPLIQPQFDYGCFLLFSLLKKNLKLKHQKTQNKCIFSQNLPPGSHIDQSHFTIKVNWLLVSDRRQSRILYCKYRF